MPKQETFDAIVIGSGATGGWAAKELTEAGMRVIVLEAGRKLDPEKDFTEHKWPYEMKYRGQVETMSMVQGAPRFSTKVQVVPHASELRPRAMLPKNDR